MNEYLGKCLCGITTYKSRSAPLNPHLCSCTMCQKSSGAPSWWEMRIKNKYPNCEFIEIKNDAMLHNLNVKLLKRN